MTAVLDRPVPLRSRTGLPTGRSRNGRRSWLPSWSWCRADGRDGRLRPPCGCGCAHRYPEHWSTRHLGDSSENTCYEVDAQQAFALLPSGISAALSPLRQAPMEVQLDAVRRGGRRAGRVEPGRRGVGGPDALARHCPVGRIPLLSALGTSLWWTCVGRGEAPPARFTATCPPRLCNERDVRSHRRFAVDSVSVCTRSTRRPRARACPIRRSPPGGTCEWSSGPLRGAGCSNSSWKVWTSPTVGVNVPVTSRA